MNRKDFEILMNSLFSNNQLFIPQGQTIEEWIDNAFVHEEKETILSKYKTLTDVRLSLFNEVYDKFVESYDDNEFTQYLNENTNEA